MRLIALPTLTEEEDWPFKDKTDKTSATDPPSCYVRMSITTMCSLGYMLLYRTQATGPDRSPVSIRDRTLMSYRVAWKSKVFMPYGGHRGNAP